MIRKNVEAIIGLLEKQTQIYRKMLDLSAEQRDQMSNPDKVNELLLQKASLVKEIEKADLSLSEFKEKWNKDKGIFNSDEQNEISRRFEEIGSLLRSLLEIEQECIMKAEQAKQENKKEMKKVNIGKKALGSYSRRSASRKSKFMDKRG
ncbi:MAG: hypothetical protein DRJ64_09470 [Thermoprotei archaeon]|nr:MAG: hypothetical protein DRJ64_09470 [Thermoprotei archaeon]